MPLLQSLLLVKCSLFRVWGLPWLNGECKVDLIFLFCTWQVRLGEKELGSPEDSEELITVDAVGCFEDDDDEEEEEEGGAGEEEDLDVVLIENEDSAAKQVCLAKGERVTCLRICCGILWLSWSWLVELRVSKVQSTFLAPHSRRVRALEFFQSTGQCKWESGTMFGMQEGVSAVLYSSYWCLQTLWCCWGA